MNNNDYERFPRQFRIEEPRGHNDEGTKNLVIQLTGGQTQAIDLTDEEFNRLEKTIHDYTQYGKSDGHLPNCSRSERCAGMGTCK